MMGKIKSNGVNLSSSQIKKAKAAIADKKNGTNTINRAKAILLLNEKPYKYNRQIATETGIAADSVSRIKSRFKMIKDFDKFLFSERKRKHKISRNEQLRLDRMLIDACRDADTVLIKNLLKQGANPKFNNCEAVREAVKYNRNRSIKLLFRK
jgi:hypothetical protein